MLSKIISAIKFRLRKLFEKPQKEVPYEQKRSVISAVSKQAGYNTFIETGTFFGETIAFFKNDFQKLISIELQPELADKARRRFQNEEHISILEGDSGELLQTIVKQLKEPAVFWLDGHYSSEFMVGDELIKTAKSDTNTPIEKELDAILSSNLPHLILIDDARDFTGRYDYPTLKAIEKTVKKNKRNYDFFVLSDIIHIIPANTN